MEFQRAVVMLLCYFIADLDSKFITPKIFQENDVVVNTGDDLTLSCKGTEPLTWTIVNYKKIHYNKTSIIKSVMDQEDSTFPYVSILRIENVSYLNTGFFYCHGIKASKDDPDRSSNIYVYVKDENRMSIVPSEDLTVLGAAPKSELIIPCLPTSPDVRVSLLSPDDEEVSPNESNFDPHRGFIIKMWSGEEKIVCVFTRNNQNETISIFVDDDSLPEIETSHLYDPTGNNIAYVGGKLVLHCCLIVPHNLFFSFKWMVNFHQIHENSRISINKDPLITIANGKLLTSSLIINNVTMEDAGKYDCSIITYSEKGRDASTYITVIDTATHIEPPKINYTGSDILIQAQDTLTLVCEGSESISWYFDDWHEDSDFDDNVMIDSYQETEYLYKAILTISDATIENAGSYVCKAEHVENDNPYRANKIFVFVQDPDTLSKFLYDFEDENMLFIMNTISNIPCKPSSPDVNVSLIDPNGKVLSESTSYEYSPKLGFSIILSERGLRNYKCIYQRRNVSQEIIIPILVLHNPEYDKTAFIEAPEKASIYAGQDLQLNCSMIIYDAVTHNQSGIFVNWTVPEFLTTGDKLVIKDEESYELSSGRVVIRRLTVKNVDVTAEGDYECVLYDSQLNKVNYISKYITVSTPVDAELILRTPGRKFVVTGEELVLNCSVKVNHNVKFTLHWSVNNKPVINTMRINIKELQIIEDFPGVIGSTLLIIQNVTLADTGTYKCIMRNHLNSIKYVEQKITIYEPLSPSIDTNLNNTEWKLRKGNSIDLHCSSSGIPVPTITWIKNNRPWVIDSNQNRIIIKDNNTRVKFLYTATEDEGKYTCRVSNTAGEAESSILLTILTDPSSWTTTQIIFIVILLILLLVIVVILIRKFKREQERKKEFKIAGLNHFEEGAVENINPNLGVDSQAELLPYDKNFEIPREKLKLGKQLGSGFFGVVLEADAFGIFPEDFKKTVAVKMVKGTADYMHIKALLSELKIMIHLGKHLNVVNLIGACTRNISKCELLVVVEYCRYGNIQNYLLKHRNNFINQIDRYTDTINISIGENIFKNFEKHRPRTCYYNVIEEDDSYANFSSSQTDAVKLQYRSYNLKNNGNRPICTHDLLCWSFQIAQGMEYLASRKVLHGDLAARNILLADDNIVKICDFGLAKNMYKNNNYKKKTGGPLPVKWMAPESITDRIFSTQSDVWSFGIVLWELFSLARTPYPEKEANQAFYDELLNGYRMSQPEYSTNAIYQIMLSCWQPNPSDRPSFNILSEEIGMMLTEHIRKYYAELNQPYANLNTKRFKNEKDLLGMMKQPDYNNLISTPITYLDIMDYSGSNDTSNSTKHPNKNKQIIQYSALDLESNISQEDLADNDILTANIINEVKNNTNIFERKVSSSTLNSDNFNTHL